VGHEYTTRCLFRNRVADLPQEHKPLPKEPDSKEEKRRIKTPKSKSLPLFVSKLLPLV
jgi:hypothetical protein